MQLHLWDDSQLRHIWSECDTTHNVETLTDWWFAEARYCGDCGATACRLSHCIHFFIPSHTSLSVNPLSVSVLQASGRFSQPQTVGELLPAPLLSSALLFETTRSFVLEVWTSKWEINCTFIAQPDERLGKCSGVINMTLLQIAALPMASCAVCVFHAADNHR